MIRALLSLAVAVASLPACSPAHTLRGGDCRPDIGPGGLLKISLDVQPERAVILKTPIEEGWNIVLANRSNGDREILGSWTKYSIRIDFGPGNVSAAVWDDASNTNVLDLETPVRTRRPTNPIVLTDRNPRNLNFNTPGTLQFYARNPHDAEWYVATARVTEEVP